MSSKISPKISSKMSSKISPKISPKISSKMSSKMTIEGDDCVWRLNGLIHREDGPAIISSDNTRYWYLYGKRHRNPADGPAIEYLNGDCVWYLYGELHNEVDAMGKTLPARKINGNKYWYQHGKLHCIDVDINGEVLPAIESANGDLEWFQHDLEHRDPAEGAAIETSHGCLIWYLYGKKVKQKYGRFIYE